MQTNKQMALNITLFIYCVEAIEKNSKYHQKYVFGLVEKYDVCIYSIYIDMMEKREQKTVKELRI